MANEISGDESGREYEIKNDVKYIGDIKRWREIRQWPMCGYYYVGNSGSNILASV
jgi:hypothetical protein